MYAVLNIKSTTFICFNRNFFFIRDLDRPVSYIAVRRVNLRLDSGVPYRNSYEYIMKDRHMRNPYN